MKARGRTEPRIAGQDRGVRRRTGKPPWRQVYATHRGTARSAAERKRPGTMSDEQTPKKELTSREGQCQSRRNQGAGIHTEPGDAEQRNTKLRPRGAQAVVKASTEQLIRTGRHGVEQSNQQPDRGGAIWRIRQDRRMIWGADLLLQQRGE